MPSADHNTELAELAGGFIHEIKNHLSTFGLHLQLLAEDFEQPQSPRDRKALERITKLQTECRRLTDVANDFLRFARLRELNRKPMPLSNVLGEMVDFFAPTARAGGLEIKTYLPADLPPVPLDRELFQQAVLNLLLNAQQAMSEGGQITMQARVDPDESAGRMVRLDVIDTGSGMSAEALGKCFRPFHTSKPGGHGLGLPTTRRIIDMHGGRINVQSEPGKGTQFTIWLPTT
jgi:signal transduction histidine kinase